MKYIAFWFKLHWNLFLSVQHLTVLGHWQSQWGQRYYNFLQISVHLFKTLYFISLIRCHFFQNGPRDLVKYHRSWSVDRVRSQFKCWCLLIPNYVLVWLKCSQGIGMWSVNVLKLQPGVLGVYWHSSISWGRRRLLHSLCLSALCPLHKPCMDWTQHSSSQYYGCWWPGAIAPGHQQPQCWLIPSNPFWNSPYKSTFSDS